MTALTERLKLAAEEVAWLTGRGYPLDVVGELVAQHHGLDPTERAALARGTCSEPQYRRRAARELEAEDVARRPLAIDAIDVIATLSAALAREPILQTLDGTVRTTADLRASFVPGPHAEAAIDRLLRGAKELRPSMLRFLVDASDGGRALAELLRARIGAVKAKAEVVEVANVTAALRKERQVVTSEPEALDACAGWFNLTWRVLQTVDGVDVIRLQ